MRARHFGLALLGVLILLVAPHLGSGHADDFIFWQLRVPRVLMAFVVGSVLGLSGAVYQTLFGNPLATPSTVGTTAGAALGALAAAVWFGSATSGPGLPWMVLMAFLGAVLVTGLVAAIAYSGRARINDVLLAGIAISLAAGALASGLQFSADLIATFQAVRWSLGNLAQVGYQRLLILLPFAGVASLAMFWHVRALESMVGGEDRAFSQGVDVRKVRAVGLGAGALGLGASVALCGPIAFVGLIVPHLARGLVGSSRRVLLPASFLGGGIFLVICDALSRVILAGQDIPVGVITSALGAPTIVWLVVKGGRKAIN